jgi:hypothetical protein
MVKFSEAIEAITAGASVTKLEWENPSTICKLRNGRLQIFLKTEGETEPAWRDWIISEADLIGLDWYVL